MTKGLSRDELEQATAAGAAASDAARAERDRLREALLGLGDGVVIVDATGEVVLRNDAARRFADARHSDAVAEEAIRELLAAAREGHAGERELQLFGPPREVLQIRAVPLRGEHGIVGAAAFVRDASEARRVESVRRDFVANVSHELKTPIGALALLAETMAGSDDPRVVRQLTDRVLREADRLGRIVDDLLDLSLIEAQEAPVREPVPVAMLISEATDRVGAAAEVAGIPLLAADVSLDLVVVCDRRQLVGAIMNLLDNAVKYSEPGQAVEIGACADDADAVVTVCDHGIGIPTRDLERIFERFYRVDRARSRETGGTGLGLSIVRHVAHAHGGEITVRSQEGEGSAFRLVLPLAARAEPERPPIDDVREAS